ncbi:c-type cytochrome [Xanthomonas vesicatoria]|uniref:C-type cytochrome n=4 Tax=Xanthomonas vesicatoria TaxID=56460 RepID=A0AAJ0IYS5_9XANT|nr:c-type cytochrome [Xanthomonas vesicatoria]APO93608.1 cytochrome C [Xanthomonas vesicatoria]APP77426.1 cytochrome C [Xanthomonas vesicatoria ATCC 35937]EGD07699.1 cytochrome c2 [Xanthomonas vesicatoria ATCC 35937]KHM94246.1 cytochrome C [Xanthomonas vesicatoria]KHM94920.1 cytochrome C [Xanthomonas vesicatoria]
MKSFHTTLLCAPLAGLLLAGALLPASARAADGKSVFISECAECHSATQGKNKKGPSLFGIVNRPAGTVADFSGYSADLKPGKGTWSTASLKDFLKKDSKATFPNTKMKYEGLEDEKELDALIAYLNTLR